MSRKHQRNQRTPQELQEKSDHLFYGWQMLTRVEQALPREKDQLLINAFIESGAVHARNLVKFLYAGKNPREDDVIAEDYFLPRPDVWKSARSQMPNTLKRVVSYANKQIAHMTYSKKPKKDWNFTPIADAIQPTLEKFISMIGNEQLGDRWRDESPCQRGRRWDKLKEVIREKGSSPLELE